MELEVLEERENTLLKRRDLKINIRHPQSSTPKKQDLIKELAARYSVPEQHVFVDYIFTKKGLQESTAKAKIYEEVPKIKIKERKVEEKGKGEKSEAQTGEAK